MRFERERPSLQSTTGCVVVTAQEDCTRENDSVRKGMTIFPQSNKKSRTRTDRGTGSNHGRNTSKVLGKRRVQSQKPVEVPQEQFLDQLFLPLLLGSPWRFHRCSFLDKVYMPVVGVWCRCQTVQKTVVMPQLQCRSWRLVPQIMGKS